MKQFAHQTTIADLNPPEEAPPPPLPKQIGPYQIESLLNTGGMSLLYLALDPKKKKTVAVKVLSPKYMEHKEVVDRFFKEAKIIALTDHPNIIKLYDQGTWEKGLYIAMEFIQGVSLRQFIQQKSLSQKRALQIILQVAYALCHLHTHGVIHRDLKPENILITESGEIKVIDFGIAQLHTDWEKMRVTQKSRFMGTPIYMSPEQKEDPLKVTYASDIYSLGIIAYELILGRLSHGVIHLTLLPKPLRGIIEKTLKIDPKERYQDIVDFITEITRYLKAVEEGEVEEEGSFEEIEESLIRPLDKLAPLKAPEWKVLEMGIAKQRTLIAAPLYWDFFKLSLTKYLLLVAEPKKGGLASLVALATLRGMVRILVESTKRLTLPLFVGLLQQALQNEKDKEEFSLATLLLDTESDQLNFLSCHSSDLYHLPAFSSHLKLLKSSNPHLGELQNRSALEVKDTWRKGDLLVLPSHGYLAEKASRELLEKTIQENGLLSAYTQAEKLLQISVKQNTSALFALVIKRLE